MDDPPAPFPHAPRSLEQVLSLLLAGGTVRPSDLDPDFRERVVALGSESHAAVVEGMIEAADLVLKQVGHGLTLREPLVPGGARG